MKTNELTEKLNYYMKKKYRIEIVEDEDEGGFVVSYYQERRTVKKLVIFILDFVDSISRF